MARENHPRNFRVAFSPDREIYRETRANSDRLLAVIVDFSEVLVHLAANETERKFHDEVESADFNRHRPVGLHGLRACG